MKTKPIDFYATGQIRPEYIPFSLTEDMLDEYTKCALDPVYFLRTHVKLNTPDGLVPFDLYPCQEEIVRAYQAGNTINIGERGIGSTTAFAGYMLWYVCFNHGHSVVLTGHRQYVTKPILALISAMYKSLPNWIKPGCIGYRKLALVLDNKSKIIIRKSSHYASRGLTVNLLAVAEFDKTSSKDQEALLAYTIPALCSTRGKIIINTGEPQPGTTLANLVGNPEFTVIRTAGAVE